MRYLFFLPSVKTLVLSCHITMNIIQIGCVHFSTVSRCICSCFINFCCSWVTTLPMKGFYTANLISTNCSRWLAALIRASKVESKLKNLTVWLEFSFLPHPIYLYCSQMLRELLESTDLLNPVLQIAKSRVCLQELKINVLLAAKQFIPLKRYSLSFNTKNQNPQSSPIRSNMVDDLCINR